MHNRPARGDKAQRRVSQQLAVEPAPSCSRRPVPVRVVQVVLLQAPAHQLHHKAASVDGRLGVQGRNNPGQRTYSNKENTQNRGGRLHLRSMRLHLV
jgi:hypothetical protein